MREGTSPLQGKSPDQEVKLLMRTQGLTCIFHVSYSWGLTAEARNSFFSLFSILGTPNTRGQRQGRAPAALPQAPHSRSEPKQWHGQRQQGLMYRRGSIPSPPPQLLPGRAAFVAFPPFLLKSRQIICSQNSDGLIQTRTA